VIVLDEAQALPYGLLVPILDVLKRLAAEYGATVVLSTATQPAFDTIPAFAAVPCREIVPDHPRHFDALRRVRYEWRIDEPMPWDEVAQLMRTQPSVLAIVNTKKDALALLAALADPDALHLSTSLCGAHRRAVIAEVKARLQSGRDCRLVATQVVEAGVDIDFPMVLRALGPLDSIIQAAGRCNREGRRDQGRVVVFRPAEGGLPRGSYTTATGVTDSVLGQARTDPSDLATSRLYFERLFKTLDLDAPGIQDLRRSLKYPEVSARFRMIDTETDPVLVAYGASDEQEGVRDLARRLREGMPGTRTVFQKLQPYVVALRKSEARRCAHAGWISPVVDGLGEWLGNYDPQLGLLQQDPDPGALVI
jgi:CRISPR-associated endonuclease/helicase Cas3